MDPSAPPPYPQGNQPGYPPAPNQPGYPPQNPYGAPNQHNREAIYRNIIQKYEISEEYARRMQLLSGFKIAFIFDDSGSMRASLDESPLNKPGSLLKASRWDELRYFADISLEIASVFDTNGSDIHFLNKGLFERVMHAQQLEPQFQEGPGGYTPLTDTFNAVLYQNRQELVEKKLLVIIVTDGQPTDRSGRTDISGFKNTLMTRSPIDKIFVTIVACTDDDSCIEYLDKWDRQIRNLDVCDDFRSERTQIRKINGSKAPFSYGDYVVKCLIGSIDPELDRQDEKSKKCIIS